MRLRDCLSISLRDIRRQPVRTGLTVMALLISSSLFVTLVTLGLETRTAIVEQLGVDTTVNSIGVTSTRTVGADLLGSNVQLADKAGGKLDDALVTRLAKLPDVTTATPVMNVWQFATFSVAGDKRRFVAKTSGVDEAGSSLFALAAGRRLTHDSAAPQVIVGFGYAKALGLAGNPAALVGRTLDLTTQLAYRGEGAELPAVDASPAEQKAFAESATQLHAQIVGVTQPAGNDNQLFVPLSWARGVASVKTATAEGTKTVDAIAKNGYTSILVQTGSSASVRPVSKAIDAMGYGTTSKQAQIDQINQLSTVMWIVLGSISLISMVSAALGIVNTMLMTVSEQRYAIAVWRACGATRSVISGLFLLQAGILGLVGGVSGTALGMWVSGRVNGKIAHLLQTQGLTSLTIDPASVTSLVTAVVLTTVLAVVAGLYPAYRAARRIEV